MFKGRFIPHIIPVLSVCVLALSFFFIVKKPIQGLHASIDEKKSIASVQKSATFLFDLHGVLFRISKRRALSRLGLFDMIGYTIRGNSTDALEDKIFEMLHQLRGHTAQTYTPLNPFIAPQHKKRFLPQIMCDWLQGTVSSEAVIAELYPLMDHLEKEQFFTSPLEIKIIKKILAIMFDPETRANIYVPLKKGIKLLKQCKAAGHKVYLLSNMDVALIDLLQEKHADIFKLFDGLIISADVKLIKPDVAIYRSTLEKYAIDPATCYVLDDQEENITGARRAHVTAMLFNPETAQDVTQLLIKDGVLPANSKKKPITA